MRTLRDVMDWIASAETPTYATLYGDLAPLYAFERERMRNFEAIADFVAGHASTGARSVADGACGTGLLLERLAERFETAVGLDASPALLGLAAERTDASVVAADLRTVVAPEAFDVYTILGGSIAHLPVEGGEDGVRAAFRSAFESLRPGGTFCCDFMERGALESGSVSVDTFADDRFRVERTTITTGEPDGSNDLGASGRYTFAYEIADRDAGETVHVGTTTPIREFDASALLGAVLNAGFTDVTLVSPPTHGTGLVAHKPV